MTQNRGLQALEDKVLAKNDCTLCGACASLCPYLRSAQGRIVKLHDCDILEGRCFDYCPRTHLDLESLHQEVFGQGYRDIELGPLKNILMARARNVAIRRNAQSGGVVTGLTSFAVKEGIIHKAILTRRNPSHLPQGVAAGGREEILGCAGSSFVASPTLEALNREPLEGEEKIGVVGTPCQVMALAKMKASPLEKRTPIDRVILTIGLFCTWALAYKPFLDYLGKHVNQESILKLDITPPPERLLKVFTDQETIDIPLDEVRPFVRPACGTCFDMTSELSDLSVGTVEGMNGWNTVIIRTERGQELMNRAIAAGIIEDRPLPEENRRHLVQVSLMKKQKALNALKDREELHDCYLALAPDLIETILSHSIEESP
ncbi:MAG: Coenzyme F420 hydrogenase/dehydrogenase, beta subunit C-terminal domain [Deltaproteobacteria bacterium]|nr:Coenzyme F420 hydrogenase/dehydrogenase, beta subunit C-terminal domain [Deltaproteobacteria bacterium]